MSEPRDADVLALLPEHLHPFAPLAFWEDRRPVIEAMAAPERFWLCRYLNDAWYALTSGSLGEGFSPDLAWRWLGLVLGAPTADEGLDVLRFLMASQDGEDRATRIAWLRLGTPGLLAYAAGLPLDEAHERAAAGTLDDVEGLAVLAGLRGWLFPPPLLAAPPSSLLALLPSS